MKPFVSAAILMLLSSACAEPLQTSGSGDAVSYEDFRASAVPAPGHAGAFLIDGDIFVENEKVLRDYWESYQTATALTIERFNGKDSKWSDTAKRQLTYCVSDDFGKLHADVVASMARVTDGGWEVFADVDFIYQPSQDSNCNTGNSSILFSVEPNHATQEYGKETAARAFFPHYAKSIRNIEIYDISLEPNYLQFLDKTLAHEVGHTLGFRHEHIRVNQTGMGSSCQEAFGNARTITEYDSSSIMHYKHCHGEENPGLFSATDFEGAQMMYGVSQKEFPIAVKGLANGIDVDAWLTAELPYGVAEVSLYVDDAKIATATMAPFSFQLERDLFGTDSNKSTYQFKLEVVDILGVTHTYTQDIAVGSDGTLGEDGTSENAPDHMTGGCSAGASGPGWMFGLCALFALAYRRRC